MDHVLVGIIIGLVGLFVALSWAGPTQPSRAGKVAPAMKLCDQCGVKWAVGDTSYCVQCAADYMGIPEPLSPRTLTAPGELAYYLCRECLYVDARDRCLEHCTLIFIVPPEECKSDMHPTPEDESGK